MCPLQKLPTITIYKMMSLIKLLVFYDYLYSPKSWLHKLSSQIKMHTIILLLLILPYMPLQYIAIYFFLCAYLHRFIYIHKHLKMYYKSIVLLFTFFLCISIQYSPINTTKRLIQICPLNYFNINNNILVNQILSCCFYLPASVVRLLSINIVYLFLMKLLLLTTIYEELVNHILNYLKYLVNSSTNQLKFEVMISAQFLKAILKHIEKIRIGYLIRNIRFNKWYIFKDNLYINFFFLQQLLFSMYNKVKDISNTIYSREINYKSLNMDNISI